MIYVARSRDLLTGRQVGMWTVKWSAWRFDRCHVVIVLVGLLFQSTALDGGAPDDDQSPTVLHRENESATPSVSTTQPELPSCYAFDSGCKLMVSTVLEAPYMMLKPDGAFLTGNDRFEGYLADILRQLASSIGFKYEIRLSRGVKHDDDVYLDRFLNGVISEVRRGHAQIGAGPLVVFNRTMQFVDFTQPFLSLRSSALLRRTHPPPPPVTHHRPPSSASSTPLPPAPHRHQPNNHHQHQQHQQQEDVITDSSQLLQSNITYGVIHNGVAYHMLAGSREPVTRAMWSRMTTHWPRAFVHSVQEGIERARRGGYAFIIDTPTAEYTAGRQPCDLYTTEPFLDVMSYAFVMRKADSGLRHVIDRELRRMKWSDEMQAMFLRWWRSECVKSSVSSSHHHPPPHPHQRSKEAVLLLPTKEQKDTAAAAAADAARHGYVVRVSNSALRTSSSFMLTLLCSCIFVFISCIFTSTAAAAR